MLLNFVFSILANAIYDGDKESEGEEEGLSPEDSRKVRKNFVLHALPNGFLRSQSLQLKTACLLSFVCQKVVNLLKVINLCCFHRRSWWDLNIRQKFLLLPVIMTTKKVRCTCISLVRISPGSKMLFVLCV